VTEPARFLRKGYRRVEYSDVNENADFEDWVEFGRDGETSQTNAPQASLRISHNLTRAVVSQLRMPHGDSGERTTAASRWRQLRIHWDPSSFASFGLATLVTEKRKVQHKPRLFETFLSLPVFFRHARRRYRIDLRGSGELRPRVVKLIWGQFLWCHRSARPGQFEVWDCWSLGCPDLSICE
jgi:hypothetical protein